MHKKIKHIIAVTLVIGSLSCVLPANNFILGTVQVQASTYKNASNGDLSSLKLNRSTGSEIQLRDSYEGDEVDLSQKKDYYIELTGADGFDISAEVKGSGYIVKVFTSADKADKGQDVGEYVKVDSSYTDVYLRTYKSEQEYKDAYDKGDVTDCEKTYEIHVKKPTYVSDEELFAEHAYLKNIYLSSGNINFSKDETSYNVNVKDDVEELLVRATPESDNYSVSINDKSVDKDKNFEQTVKLDKGNNTIKITVESDDETKVYTLNVYRGNNAAVTTATQTTQNATSGVQSFSIQNTNKGTFNSWQRVDGKWQYIDGTGQTLKNKWWFDKDSGKNYYLKENGYRATGWLSDNSNWYYFNENGEMQTGWICLNKNWYYLNKSGAMQMGWLEDSSGNWYYLDKSGAMKTGWVENSDGKWYYFDSTGKMVENPVNN